MSEDLYDFFFEVVKEINRASEEVYKSLENKISTLIATNTIVISIVIGLGSILIEIINLDEVLSQNLSILISVSVIFFTVSLFVSLYAFTTKKYEILNPYKFIEKYKTTDEKEAKEVITDTFASTVKTNRLNLIKKAHLIDISIGLLFIGVLWILIFTIVLFYITYFTILPK